MITDLGQKGCFRLTNIKRGVFFTSADISASYAGRSYEASSSKNSPEYTNKLLGCMTSTNT